MSDSHPLNFSNAPKNFHEQTSAYIFVKHDFGTPKTESFPPSDFWYTQTDTPHPIFHIVKAQHNYKFYPWTPKINKYHLITWYFQLSGHQE